MEKSEYVRNAKFWGILTTPEFLEDLRKTNVTLRNIAKHIRKQFKLGNIHSVDKFNITMKDGTKITAAQYKNKFPHIFGSGALDKVESLKRTLLMYVLERFHGYSQRNDNKKIPTITIKGKSLYYKDRYVSFDKENKTITFPTIYGNHELKFSESLKDDLIETKKFGGNFIVKQNAFVATIQRSLVPAYEPKTELGFDLNKTPKDWVALNDGETISAPDSVVEKCEEIREVNKMLDKDKSKPVAERELRSPQRRKLRFKWKKLHKELKRIVAKIFPVIIQKAIDNEALLCIDSVKSGQAMGTFGQDYLIPALQTACEDKNIPFYVIPCAYTSQRCSECGHTAKENRTTTEDFCCVSCGFEEVSHKNAAINIAYQGKRLYDAGVPYGNYRKRKVDTLIEKHLAATKSKLVPLN
jgi:transposase